MPSRLHVSLLGFGDHRGLPSALVELAKSAASAAASEVKPFDVDFTRAGSFRSRRPKKPFVLTHAGKNETLHQLVARLDSALEPLGASTGGSARFNPHVTLAYDEKTVAEEPVPPVNWRATEMVLVHSLLGRTRHVPIGCWKLTG